MVAHPNHVKVIWQARAKTDPIDARKLGELARVKHLPAIWIPDPATRRPVSVAPCLRCSLSQALILVRALNRTSQVLLPPTMSQMRQSFATAETWVEPVIG